MTCTHNNWKLKVRLFKTESADKWTDSPRDRQTDRRYADNFISPANVVANPISYTQQNNMPHPADDNSKVAYRISMVESPGECF